jgi:rhodanese-related sulfurtransferase
VFRIFRRTIPAAPAAWLLFSISIFVIALGPQVVDAGHENRDVTTISVDRLKLLIDSGEKFVLVDLRPTKAFQEKRLPGARTIPAVELEARLNEIPKSGRVVVYGEAASNDIPDFVFQLFEDERYRNITVLLEGFEGWEKRKFPVETKRK